MNDWQKAIAKHITTRIKDNKGILRVDINHGQFLEIKNPSKLTTMVVANDKLISEETIDIQGVEDDES